MLRRVLHHPMDTETHKQHLPGEKIKDVFQRESGGWEAEACTPPGVLLRYSWG
jgi:hypothetical protein